MIIKPVQVRVSDPQRVPRPGNPTLPIHVQVAVAVYEDDVREPGLPLGGPALDGNGTIVGGERLEALCVFF